MAKWIRSAAFGVAGLACAGAASAEIAYGVTNRGRLISFDTNNPTSILTGMSITGLAGNEVIDGLDMRPNDGMLYGLGSQNNLYRINRMTGAATLVGALNTALNGSSFGFDFNPTGPVALRVVSDTNSNYRLPTPAANGNVLTDTNLAYVAGDAKFGMDPNVVHVAYTNNFLGSTSTVLYGIDATHDTLVRFDAPNAGTLRTVGVLGMGGDADINSIGGFDISGMTGMAFAVTQNSSRSSSTLWGINLMTGAGTNLGTIGGGETLVGFTMIPSPGSASMLVLAGLVSGRRRRR
jgi:hypothetical protein